jgi:protein dithiol oxidoreductase (disulfide-forming)
MNSFKRVLAPILVCLFVLAACKPSIDKPVPSSLSSAPTTLADKPASSLQPIASIASASDKPVANQSAVNAPQASSSDYYSTLTTPQAAEKGSKVEVLEFFAYFCSHCKSFDPLLSTWAKKNANRVIFKRVPVVFRDNMVAQQRMFYALQAMGKLEGLHDKVFHAVQVERRALTDESDIMDFIVRNGVDKNKFKELYDSFSIQSQANNASSLQKNYMINSVPNIAIDGRFMTSAEHALKRPGTEQTETGGQTATLQIMDELVTKVLKERGSTGKSR